MPNFDCTISVLTETDLDSWSLVGGFGTGFDSTGRSKNEGLCSIRIVASVVQRCSVIIVDSLDPCESLFVDVSTLFVWKELDSGFDVYIYENIYIFFFK